MGGFQADDLAAIREEGSLVALFTQLAGKSLKPPVEDQPGENTPKYHIRRPGAWPCGTAPSGPTPPPCDDCPPHNNPPHQEQP
jgi:hypothetical protein